MRTAKWSQDLGIQPPAPIRTLGATAVRYRIRHGEIDVSQTLVLAELARRSAIRTRCSTTHSQAITGKTVDGIPLKNHLHAHYIPLDEDGDGWIDHLTIYAPGGFSPADIVAFEQLRGLESSRSRIRIGIDYLGAGATFEILCPIFAAALRWHSATPFSLPRFGSRGKGKKPRPRDLPEAQLLAEFRVRDLPVPTTVRAVEGYRRTDGWVLPWTAFQTCRRDGSHGHGIVGFEIEFAEPFRGPIALGFGCHFGLGTFVPDL